MEPTNEPSEVLSKASSEDPSAVPSEGNVAPGGSSGATDRDSPSPGDRPGSGRDGAGSDGRAAEIVHKLRAIRPLHMRSVVLAEFLGSIAPGDAVDALAALIVRASSSSDPDYAGAVECLVVMLGEPDLLPYRARASLYAAAKERGHHAVRRLFFDSSATADDEDRDDASAVRPVTPRGRPLTLGERKSLARSHRRDLLVHLLRDPHPDVIRILLGNPHLTESDVLGLASRRPAAGSALAEIAGNPRWATRYAVKRALVRNPYTPLALAMRLATTLRRTDLRVISQDPQLAELLREHAAGLVL